MTTRPNQPGAGLAPLEGPACQVRLGGRTCGVRLVGTTSLPLRWTPSPGLASGQTTLSRGGERGLMCLFPGGRGRRRRSRSRVGGVVSFLRKQESSRCHSRKSKNPIFRCSPGGRGELAAGTTSAPLHSAKACPSIGNGYSVYLGVSSSQSHVQDHHEGKAQQGAAGGKVAVAVPLRFRDQFLDHDKQHSAGGKGQGIR